VRAAAQTRQAIDLFAEYDMLSWRNIGPFRGGRASAITGRPAAPYTFFMGTAGGGVWKTTNAGQSWTNVSDGFFKTASLGHIEAAPSNPDVVYVGAQGALYGPTQERGVYRSRDGGVTWTRVLFVGETSGVSDLVMDPSNPDVLYASVWDHLRLPWEMQAFRPNSGVYKTTDGGDTWQRLSGPT
jgi:hypothetical protein